MNLHYIKKALLHLFTYKNSFWLDRASLLEKSHKETFYLQITAIYQSLAKKKNMDRDLFYESNLKNDPLVWQNHAYIEVLKRMYR